MGTVAYFPYRSDLTENFVPCKQLILILVGDALDALRNQRTIPTLRALTNDVDDDCRAIATVAFANLGDAQGLEGLLAYLPDDNIQIRAGAAIALGGLKNPRAVESLIAELTVPALPNSSAYQG